MAQGVSGWVRLSFHGYYYDWDWIAIIIILLALIITLSAPHPLHSIGHSLINEHLFRLENAAVELDGQ